MSSLDENEKERISKTMVKQMKDIHPENPFGINYKAMERHTKIHLKFNKLDKYVMMSQDDQDKIVREKFKMYSRASFFGLLALFIPGYYRKVKKSPLVSNNHTIYLMSQFLFFFTGAQLAYTTNFFKLTDNVYQPLIEKYKQDAIQNGFQDYEISEDFNSKTIIHKIVEYLFYRPTFQQLTEHHEQNEIESINKQSEI